MLNKRYTLGLTPLLILLTSAMLNSYAQDKNAFHKSIIVVDGHNDVIYKSILPGKDIGKRMTTGHTDIPRLLEGGVDVQVFAVW